MTSGDTVKPVRAAASGTGLVGVLEIDPTGHRLQYLRHLADAAGHDRCVVLTTEHAVRSEEYAAHAASLTALAVLLPDAGSARAALAAAVKGARASGVRRLVVPDGDRYLLPLLLTMLRHPRLPLEIRLLLMRTATIGGVEKLRPATIVKPILVQILRACPQVRVRFLTDALGVITRRRGYPGIRGVQDPVQQTDEPDPVRPSWFPPADPATTQVGVFGVISARKNLPLLLAALALAPDAVAVVGGRLEPDVREFLDSPDARALVGAGRVVVADRLLPRDEFAAALASVDLVAVLHDNDAPSGILAEACLRRTPVLVPVDGWLAEVVDSTGLGVATPLTARGVADGIARVARDREAHVAAAQRHAPRMSTRNFTEGLLGS